MHLHHRSWKTFLPLCLGLLFLSACAPHELPAPFGAWQYTDVKVLDDDGISHTEELSSPDLLALYLRESEQEIQLRLDFFDLAQTPNFDLHLAFDTVAGGIKIPHLAQTNFAWDIRISITASGRINVLDDQGNSIPQAQVQVFRDPSLDYLTVSVSKEALPMGLPEFQVLAWLTAPGSAHILDSLPVAYSAGRPPQPVNLLMAFSDCFPAYTPAQALRRWDGAHTGPSGGRHGLYNLLRISANFQIPVVLLDLYNPTSLSALNYMGKLEEVSNLIAAGFVIAPQYAPTILASPGIEPASQVQHALFSANQEWASNFGIRQPLLLYSPSGYIPPDSQARIVFVPRMSDDSVYKVTTLVQPQRRRDRVVISLPENSAVPQASVAGPGNEFKQMLVDAMLETQASAPGNGSNLAALGGSLPASNWGDPQAARAALRYLAARPWLNFLDENELLTLRGQPNPGKLLQGASQYQPDHSLVELWQAIESAPPNQLSQAAQQVFLAAANPVYPQAQELGILRQIYLKHTWIILAAAEWGEHPHLETSCSVDLDRDGAPECLFANNYLYAVFSKESGALTHLFYRGPGLAPLQSNLHQIIGPSSQIISGLSEPSSWNLAAGYGADPAVISGAFDTPGKPYDASTLSDGIVFAASDESQKSYHFTDHSLSIRYRAPSECLAHSPVSIPLLPDPWLRFKPGWWDDYRIQTHQGIWQVRWVPDFEILLNADLPVYARSFLDSQSWMAFTENPNREQPGGHFLPFPMLAFDLPKASQFEVVIQFVNLDQ